MPNYKESGVDYSSVGSFRDAIIRELTFEGNEYRRAAKIGHYSGLISFLGNYIALHTDNVGTKTIIASKYGYFDQIGYDLVGANVNDIACIGAKPMAMVNYIAGSMPDSRIGKIIGKSINEACKEADIPMIGGETASVPDLVKGLDISGTVVGFLEKGKEITGMEIEEGDRVIGLSSNGVHTNGFSLIRKIYEGRETLMEEHLGGKPFWKSLLNGHRIYSKQVLGILDQYRIHGIFHITGGGVRNILRLKDMRFKLNYPEIPPIFRKIMEDGAISAQEAFEVFNMGIGMILISSKSEEDAIIQDLRIFDPVDLGEVVRGKGVSIDNYGVRYSNYY